MFFKYWAGQNILLRCHNQIGCTIILLLVGRKEEMLAVSLVVSLNNVLVARIFVSLIMDLLSSSTETDLSGNQNLWK